jgi:hypothetical protein
MVRSVGRVRLRGRAGTGRRRDAAGRRAVGPGAAAASAAAGAPGTWSDHDHHDRATAHDYCAAAHDERAASRAATDDEPVRDEPAADDRAGARRPASDDERTCGLAAAGVDFDDEPLARRGARGAAGVRGGTGPHERTARWPLARAAYRIDHRSPPVGRRTK